VSEASAIEKGPEESDAIARGNRYVVCDDPGMPACNDDRSPEERKIDRLAEKFYKRHSPVEPDATVGQATQDTNREHYAYAWKDANDNIHMSKTYYGDVGQTHITVVFNELHKGDTVIALFHTHPTGSGQEQLSVGDVFMLNKDNQYVPKPFSVYVLTPYKSIVAYDPNTYTIARWKFF
jgi:hypothetical protein